MARKPNQDDEAPEEPSRPPPYEIEEAFQEAFTQPPQLPHTDDIEERYARLGRKQNRETEQNGTENGTEQNSATEQGDSALVNETRSSTESLGPARAKLPPLTLAEKLRPLRPWMRSYVTALMNLGGNDTLACQRVRVALHSCIEYQQLVPEFAATVREAKDFATGLVKASLFQSASIGDLEAVYRGPYLVGWKRVKSVKAAELLLEMSGDLGDRGRQNGSTVNVRGNVNVVVQQVTQTDIPAAVHDTVARLIQANRGRPIADCQTGETPS